MCLCIDNFVKPKKPNTDGYCVGWKLITKDNKAPYFNSFEYHIGENIPSNLKIELNSNRVNHGLHLFLSRKSARNESMYDGYEDVFGVKVIKVYYKPEDVIAYGYGLTQPSVAVRKLLIKSLKPQ